MKVQIKQLKPNPFRDIKNYPINEEKIKSLVGSILQTGFWDNILARKNNGKVEIAYGHHRLIALQREFPSTHVVDIPIKRLDDPTMIRIMANENMDDWTVTPKVIDETVRVTKDFLEKNLDIAKKYGRVKKPIGKKIISRFLGGNWNETRVHNSLNRLDLIYSGELDKEAVESMPTEQAASDFVQAVKWSKPKKETQKKVAKKIVESRKKDSEAKGIFGKYRMEDELFEEERGVENRKREEKRKLEEKERKRQFETYLEEVAKKADSLRHSLVFLLQYKDILLSDHYQKSKEGQDFVLAMAELFDTFRILMSAEERKADLIESFKVLIKTKKKEEK